VTDDDCLAGIISERDIIAAFAKYGKPAADKLAAEIMTASVVTCKTTTDPADVLAMMSQNAIRHVPVLDGKKILGLVSIRDILDFQQQMLLADNVRRQQDASALAESLSKIEEAFEKQTTEFRIARDIAVEANNAKTVFLANMSHELRTPLNAIIGFSDVMRTESLGPMENEQYRAYVGDINQSGIFLLSLINDLLDMAKMESGKEELFEEPVDVGKTIDAAIRLVRGQAQKADIVIEVNVENDIPYLWADPRKLQQILTNLLSNAVKFTVSGGDVTARIWCNPKSGLVFQIADTGIGIAQQNIPKALSQFGQVDSALNRKFEGSGLGLPLAKEFAELHGGSLDLQSELGVGTTVTVRFPASRIMEKDAKEFVA
jgi:signal transduction histidine kinase